MSNEIMERTGNIIPVDEVKRQVQLIQDLMKRLMKDGEHFGTIPGCGEKKTLLKAGAEKISFMFRLSPDYKIERIDLSNGHREYIITCTLRHVESGLIYGQGVGSCSTMEGKYRYRWDNTGRPVPTEYWETRDPEILGGPQFAPRKQRGNDGKQTWIIFQKVDHADPADYYNTTLKMAKKRAHVDATLTATAASDIFEQDIDDDIENGIPKDQQQTEPPEYTPVTPRQRSDGGNKERPTQEELDDFENRMIAAFGSGEKTAAWLSSQTKSFKEIKSVAGITTKKWLAKLIEKFEAETNGNAQGGLFNGN